MLELWHNLNSGYFIKSTTNPTEFILPPFFAGQTLTVRYHTLQPTGNPVTPFTEVQATSGLVSLTAGTAGTAVNFALVNVSGQLYMQGTFTIPAATTLIPANTNYQDVFFGVQIIYGGDKIYLEANATVKIPAMSTTSSPTTFTHTLTAGDEDGIVLDFTSMGLATVPSYIRIDNAVQKTAADQANIYASIVISTLTDTTVQCELNAPCDVTGRTFNWTVIP